ncbi:WD40 repeat-like protein [Butyriboletus roseoflavus]|nr:WD40 repeat-like protein [Butyriboletus roseoflavus]
MDADELPLTVPYQSALPTFPHEISVSSTARLQVWRRQMASNVWARRLDRVNVLGSDVYGHTGCVNALSWSQNGELLISGGDDQQLRVWRMDHSSDTQNEYPFACQTVIDTGHSANIFNAHMLPSSTRIATVAGDKQVRVFDVGESVGRSPSGNEMSYSTRQACIHVLRCHTRRTKRIITEDSPDFFLTVAEDGEVRQHDLRTPHSCTRGGCPAPLVRLPHELSTIALSPLTPYQFVVGGESPFVSVVAASQTNEPDVHVLEAHLFDRRHVGRHLQEEWGMSPAVDDVTTCVRRFSRYSRAPGEAKGYEHITGARMSAWNGHEVPFNSDAVYIYSTRDEPGESSTDRNSSILPPNSERGGESLAESPSKTHNDDGRDGEEAQGILENLQEDEETEMEAEDLFDDSEDNDDVLADGPESDDDQRVLSTADMHPDAPVVYPRMRFYGHCNVETVKDGECPQKASMCAQWVINGDSSAVNFLGPYDEYVTSGSDDGNFFIWKKSTGELVDVLEGDSSVVNVIEGHPTLPLVAVSGIDATIKVKSFQLATTPLLKDSPQLFAPARGPAAHSKYRNATSIVKRNARASRRGINHSANLQLARLIMHHHDRALEVLQSTEDETSADSEARLAHCINQ